MSGSLKNEFATNGFIGPVRILDPDECPRLLSRLRAVPRPPVWGKALAVHSHIFYSLGTLPAIVDRVAELLGDNVLLWGASLVNRKPGEVHPWHTDIETSSSVSTAVTVWIGLANTNRNSSLQLITRSHRYGIVLQERAQQGGIRREDIRKDSVLEWSLEYDPKSSLEQLDIADGESVFFDGRLWHGSENTNLSRTRSAIILHYVAANEKIKIPDFSRLEWPFKFHDDLKAPCLVVRGSGLNTPNLIVAPPSRARRQKPTLVSSLKQFEFPLDGDAETGWKPYPIFGGSTLGLKVLKSHASVLFPGMSAHELVNHVEEEFLISLGGDTEIEYVVDDATMRTTRENMSRGTFVYYPSQKLHTIRNTTSEPITYLTLKWEADAFKAETHHLQTSVFNIDALQCDPSNTRANGVSDFPVLEAETGFLRKVKSSVRQLESGEEIVPHIDAFDSVVVVITGTIQTLGQSAGPNAVLCYPSGEEYSIRNLGVEQAKLLVFEFHSHGNADLSESATEWVNRRLVKPIRKRIVRFPLRVRRKIFRS